MQVRKVIWLLFLATTSIGPIGAASGAWYEGKFIDAHNQFGCDSRVEDIQRLLKESSVDFTLLSARRPCDNDNPFDAHQRVLDVIEALPDKVGLIISTKIGGSGGVANRANRTLLRAEKELAPKAYGYAEILVQHHETDDQNSEFKGLRMQLSSPEILRTIEVVMRSKKPLVLHLEPRDHPEMADETLRQLDEFLAKVSPYPVFLIHLGQLTSEQAELFLKRHENLNLILSTVEPFAQRGIARRHSVGETAQSGWVNIFEDDGQNFRRKNFESWASSVAMRPQWRRLLEAFPDRFVIGIESVYAKPWLDVYLFKVNFWRYALHKLPSEVSKKIACENAVRHWALPLKC